MINCKTCGRPFERPIQRGRPAVRCLECRAKDLIITDTRSNDSNDKDDTSELPDIIPIKSTSQEDPYALYRLMVGNMGLAYVGESERAALDAFTSYSKKSNMGFGQVGFQIVQLWKLNRELNSYCLEKEFIPERGYT